MARGAPDYQGTIRDIGAETLLYNEGDDIDDEETQVIFDIVGRDIELQHYEFASDHGDIYTMLDSYDKAGDLVGALQIPRRTALSDIQPSPAIINLEQSIMFLELVYDTSNDYYKFGLGYPIRFANGAKLSIYSQAGATKKYYVAAILLLRS